ncbi:hypothetical protein CR970_03775 [Candidatus Saccharibacteria bacterium]|nr:MAG: hypothetical protein CR970_03775 [Candidatus Saccharibacteria bacterium]
MTEVITIAISANAVIRILALGLFSFLLSMLITPVYTTLAYRYKWWRKSDRRSVAAGAPRRNIPTMAGGLFVLITAIVTLWFNLDANETMFPLAVMVGAGAMGLFNDLLAARFLASVRRRIRLVLYSLVALSGGWWYYAQLDADMLYLPWTGELFVGWLIVPIFWLVVVASARAVNVTDGLAGLAGGLLSTAFALYSAIALLQGEYVLAGFCMTIVGSLLSYTWFNIPPARFYMGDVGAIALGAVLGVVALQTDTLYVLPFIGAVFVVEYAIHVWSQIVRRRGEPQGKAKGSWRTARTLHELYILKGWPDAKITMRLWVLGQVAAAVGLAVFLVGRG